MINNKIIGRQKLDIINALPINKESEPSFR